ncbi:MAG: hypothetical protein AAGG75_07905 [Bacteroidota bacterium]
MDKFIIPLILSIALLLPARAFAQDCFCTNCSQSIPINSTTNITFDVTGATNDNLANASQGVCGIVLEFRHDFIWAVEMTLISPAGQQIQLIGPTVVPPLGAYTGFAYWDISFVPAAVAATPDPPFSIIWDNNQNWQTAGRYNGSYYPFMGTLEDFNLGSVNGTWTLSINNVSTFYTGFLDDFQIIFCDESGLDCEVCAPDAGQISVTNDIADCEGGAALEFSPLLTYGSTAPDPAEYSYTYLLTRNDSILAYQSSPDLRSYPPGNYLVCGLSYLTEDASRLPATSTDPTLSVLETLATPGINPFLCADLTDDCISVAILPGIRVAIRDTICEGSSYNFEGNIYTASGQYEVTLPAMSSSCDSIRALDLWVQDTVIQNISATICEGSSYDLGGTLYNTSGSYSASLVDANGCDSTINLALTVTDTVIQNISATICEGSSYDLGGTLYSTSGSYSASLVDANGCDSTITLTLTVTDTVIENISATICEGSSYDLGGTLYSTSGSYSASLVDANGCDSTINLTLTVTDTVIQNISATICEGSSYDLGGTLYSTSGSYSASLVDANGCDSTINLALTVTDTTIENISATICQGSSYDLAGTLYNTSGSYSATLPSSAGCDSTINLICWSTMR